MFGSDGWYSQRVKKRKSENGRYFRVAVTFGWAAAFGNCKKGKKLTLLSGGRYFRGAATLGTLRYQL